MSLNFNHIRFRSLPFSIVQESIESCGCMDGGEASRGTTAGTLNRLTFPLDGECCQFEHPLSRWLTLLFSGNLLHISAQNMAMHWILSPFIHRLVRLVAGSFYDFQEKHMQPIRAGHVGMQLS